MVDFNLINSLGNMDDEVDTMVATALGDAATDLSKLITSDEVQDFTPGAIIKGKVSGKAGDDFIVELGLKSEGILERNDQTENENAHQNGAPGSHSDPSLHIALPCCSFTATGPLHLHRTWSRPRLLVSCWRAA